MADLTLHIGNKAYSSWSLRPWLALRAAGLPFAEVVVPLRQPDTKDRILAVSPAGKLPVLRHGDLTVWDSLAICEYVAELAPAAGLWPDDAKARAVARAAVAEMHSGFQDLRRNLFMDLKRRHHGPDRVAAAAADTVRVQSLWRQCRERFGEGGPFLFGRFGIADCFYAPVCTRFTTWGVALEADSQAYVDAVLSHPAFREWQAGAEAETIEIDYLAM